MGYYSDNTSEQKYYTGQEQVKMPADNSSDINIMEWLMRFAKYWYVFLITFILALGAAYIKNRSWVPMYTVESKIILESSNVNNAYNFMQGFGSSTELVSNNNQLFILGSYDLINKTVSQLPFGVDFYTKGRFRTYSLYGKEPIIIDLKYLSQEAYMYEFKFIPIDNKSYEIVLSDDYSDVYPDFCIKGEYGKPFENNLMFATINKLYLPTINQEFLFRFRSLASLENEFASRISINYISEESSVVSLSLTGNVVERDKDFLNALGETFLAYNLNKKNQEAIRTIDFINQQLGYIADSLKSSEERLRRYRSEHNILDVNGYTSTVLSKLNLLNTHRSEMNLKEAYFNELSAYLNSNVESETLIAPSSIGISDPVLMNLIGTYNELLQKRGDIGEQNPGYERYTKRLQETRQTILEVLENVRNAYDLERELFDKEYAATMKDLQMLPEKELEMINYERTYKINDNYYTYLLQKQSEARIRQASNVPDNEILQKARINASPINTSQKTRTYLIFIVIGILLPAIFIILRELMNVTIRTEADIARITPVPILGIIRHTDNKKDKVVSNKDVKSLYTEGYRVIRSRMEFIVKRKSNISIMITSSESNDGKSHFATNLAGVYSLLSPKTLLIDLDLRNPNLSKKLGYEKDTKGLTHVLIGDATIDEAIITGDESLGFDFLPAGVIPFNPAELIRSEEMNDILQELKTRYDYIIIDTSPLGLVADSYAMAEMVDINLIVARVFKTNKNFFKDFMQQIQKDEIPNVYIVMNDLIINKKGYGNYNYMKYGRYHSSEVTRYYHSQGAKYYTDNK